MKKKIVVKKEAYPIHCREVICPFCDHRFMWMDTAEFPNCYYYRNKKTGERASGTVCPQCREEIIMEPHELLAAAPCEGGYDRIGVRIL